MGRKPKCTVEEKISAVEDYLNGIRSVSEIMVDLSIKSTRTIRDWILAYQNGGIKALCSVTANHSYSSEFKIEMVRKYINGEGSVTELCARYGIPAHTTLQKWISLYNANRELRDYDPKREVYMALYNEIHFCSVACAGIPYLAHKSVTDPSPLIYFRTISILNSLE